MTFQVYRFCLVVVVSTGQSPVTESELKFSTGSSPACGLCVEKNFGILPWLEIRFDALSLVNRVIISHAVIILRNYTTHFCCLWKSKLTLPFPIQDEEKNSTTHREKVTSNKTPAISRIRNMSIWIVGTSNQLFIRGSQTETKISKR